MALQAKLKSSFVSKWIAPTANHFNSSQLFFFTKVRPLHSPFLQSLPTPSHLSLYAASERIPPEGEEPPPFLHLFFASPHRLPKSPLFQICNAFIQLGASGRGNQNNYLSLVSSHQRFVCFHVSRPPDWSRSASRGRFVEHHTGSSCQNTAQAGKERQRLPAGLSLGSLDRRCAATYQNKALVIYLF